MKIGYYFCGRQNNSPPALSMSKSQEGVSMFGYMARGIKIVGGITVANQLIEN